MKKFTKLMSMLLAVVMMLGLVACSNGGETPAPTGTTPNTPATEAPTAPAAPTVPRQLH